MAMFKTLPMMATVYGEWVSKCSVGDSGGGVYLCGDGWLRDEKTERRKKPARKKRK